MFKIAWIAAGGFSLYSFVNYEDKYAVSNLVTYINYAADAIAIAFGTLAALHHFHVIGNPPVPPPGGATPDAPPADGTGPGP